MTALSAKRHRRASLTLVALVHPGTSLCYFSTAASPEVASPRTHWCYCSLLLVPVLPTLRPASPRMHRSYCSLLLVSLLPTPRPTSRQCQTGRRVISLPTNPLTPLPPLSAGNTGRSGCALGTPISPCSSRGRTGGRLPRRRRWRERAKCPDALPNKERISSRYGIEGQRSCLSMI